MSSGILFDFDGVLIDSEALHFRAYNEVLERYDIQVDQTTYAREWIAAGHGTQYAVETFGLPMTPDELKKAKDPVYNALLRAEVRLMPGVEAALQRLAASFPLVVATNSPVADVGFVLDRFGLRDHFTDVVTRERYQTPKPAPDCFLAAAEAIRLPPASCLVVEDAYKGVAAAAAGGFPCVAIPHTLTEDNDFSTAARILDSLDQLTVALVEELTA